MVTIDITIETTGNHAYIAENGNTGYTTCLHSQPQTGMDVKENRGSSNHGTAHTYNYTKNITVGDTLTASIWEYIYANSKSIKLYINGKLVAQNSGTVQCATATTTITAEMIRSSYKGPTPTYFEQLHKLDCFSKAQYVPYSNSLI